MVKAESPKPKEGWRLATPMSPASRHAPIKEEKTVTVNRRAYHEYDILKRVEAGVALTGSEVKALRLGRANLRDAYAHPGGGELWLLGAHIGPYPPAGPYGHEAARRRKLLLHREEIAELSSAVQQKGLTLVPLRLYLKGGIAKVELALARGRKLYDKRRAIAKREAQRQMQRALGRRP